MDFRTYLKQTAPQYLAFTGNDARIDPTKRGYDTPIASYANTDRTRQTVQNEVNQLFNKYSIQAFKAPNIMGSFGGGNYQPQAPPFDLAGAAAQARKAAIKSQSPYYALMMKKFVQQQAADKAQQQAQLQQTQQENQLQGQRTSQDVLQQEQQIGQQADYTQQDQGTQFDQARIAQAKQTAAGGLTSSGLGQQQSLEQQTTRNIQEQRQAVDVKQQVAQQELLKARTFEDIGRSNKLAKFNFSSFIQQQGRDLSVQKISSEKAKQADIVSETARQKALRVEKFIQSISNPGQRQAARAAYG